MSNKRLGNTDDYNGVKIFSFFNFTFIIIHLYLSGDFSIDGPIYFTFRELKIKVSKIHIWYGSKS